MTSMSSIIFWHTEENGFWQRQVFPDTALAGAALCYTACSLARLARSNQNAYEQNMSQKTLHGLWCSGIILLLLMLFLFLFGLHPSSAGKPLHSLRPLGSWKSSCLWF